MKTFTVDDPRLGRLTYTDEKRYLWLLSVLFPLIPLIGIGLMNWSGWEWTLWLPLVFLYVLIPLLDYLFPNDRSNPPEQLVPQLENRRLLPDTQPPDGSAAFLYPDRRSLVCCQSRSELVGDAGDRSDGRRYQRFWHQYGS